MTTNLLWVIASCQPKSYQSPGSHHLVNWSINYESIHLIFLGYIPQIVYYYLTSWAISIIGFIIGTQPLPLLPEQVINFRCNNEVSIQNRALSYRNSLVWKFKSLKISSPHILICRKWTILHFEFINKRKLYGYNHGSRPLPCDDCQSALGRVMSGLMEYGIILFSGIAELVQSRYYQSVQVTNGDTNAILQRDIG